MTEVILFLIGLIVIPAAIFLVIILSGHKDK